MVKKILSRLFCILVSLFWFCLAAVAIITIVKNNMSLWYCIPVGIVMFTGVLWFEMALEK